MHRKILQNTGTTQTPDEIRGRRCYTPRMRRLLPLLFVTVVCTGLASCTTDSPPVISFIGIATGTLVTDLNTMQFKSTFDPQDRNLVGVVGFEHIQQGSTVQATWFSPDDRRMPLGRTSIVTQSGATIARFSFASKDPWVPAPYMLQIDVYTGEGDSMRSATGSVQFYIGMNDEEISSYRKEFAEWKTVEETQRAEWEQQQEQFQQLLATIRQREGFDHSLALLRTDLTGDRSEDYVIADIDTETEQAPPGGPGVLLSATVGRFAIVDHSGSTLLSVNDTDGKRTVSSLNAVLSDILPTTDEIQLTVLPSFSVSLYWPKKTEICFIELDPVAGGYAISREGCRAN